VAPVGLCLEKLPFIDTYRTLLPAPPTEVRDILLAVKEFGNAV
jgi:hypothetical protein